MDDVPNGLPAALEVILNRAADLGLSDQALCKGAGLKPDFLRDIRRGKSKNPSHVKIELLANFVSTYARSGIDRNGKLSDNINGSDAVSPTREGGGRVQLQDEVVADLVARIRKLERIVEQHGEMLNAQANPRSRRTK